MKLCNNCKTKNVDGAIYCSGCGEKLSIVDFCRNPKCRKPLPMGATFCPECGSRVSQEKQIVKRRLQQEKPGEARNVKSKKVDTDTSTIAGILYFLDIFVLPSILMFYFGITNKWVIGIIVIVIGVAIIACDDMFLKKFENKIKNIFR